jgi:hypothetical protein
MTHLYAVAVELYDDPGETRQFNIQDELRTIEAVEVVRSVWVVARDGTASDLTQFATQFLLKNDRLFVVEITGQPSFKNPRVTNVEMGNVFRPFDG